MNKKAKKVLAVTMAVAMSACLVAGATACNKRKEGEIKVTAWNSGWGDEWLYAMAEEFEKDYPEYTVTIDSSAAGGDITNQFPASSSHDYDVFFGCNNNFELYDTCYANLDDVMTTVNPGETKTVAEKLGPEMQALLVNAKGHYDKMCYGAGYYTIVYKPGLFDKWGYDVPNTTDELAALCDTMREDDVVPFIHFVNGGYWHEMLWAWAIQYAGPDEFYQMSANPKLSQLTSDTNGVKQGLDAMWKVLGNRKNYYTGSTGMEFTTAQTFYLSFPEDIGGTEIAMMVNGSWLENEMKNSEDPLETNIKSMKTPVVSSIIDKCDTINDDATLSAVIAAIDKGETSYAGVSEADFARIKTVRSYEVTNAPGLEIAIPNYSENLEGAKKFAAYFYSDKVLKIFYEKTGIRQFATMDDETFVYDTSKLSSFQKSQLDIANRAKPVGEGTTHNTHPVFNVGGLRLTGKYDLSYAGAMVNQPSESSTDIWNGIATSLNENWSTYWANAGLQPPQE